MNNEKIFLHGISLSNFLPCWNLSLSGRISSPDFLAKLDAGLAKSHKSIRDIDINQLKNGNFPEGVLTPRGGWYGHSFSLLRKGMHLQTGIKNPKEIPKEEEKRILRMGDIELKFEEMRRKIAPEAPSRLSCIYLAENSEAGREQIKKMLGDNIFLLKVKILMSERLAKADVRWFDAYCENQKEEYIENYWKGISKDTKEECWEYLIDGIIVAIDQEELEYIKKFGTKPLIKDMNIE